MKKIVFVALLACLSASVAMAATFSPSLLKLTAPAGINYKFDGTNLNIPVTVSGTPASVVFCLFTSDKAASISNVRNGYLGWHFVNKIDTCIYASPMTPFDKGTQNILWNGKDENGVAMPAGNYTYYLWGYDNITPKQKVTSVNMYPSRGGYLQELGPDAKPLNNPYIIRGLSKWTIGKDPEDQTLRETTSYTLPEKTGLRERIVLQPNNHNMFFAEIHNEESGSLALWKFKWVPNGVAELVSTWGENGAVTLPVTATGDYSANWFTGASTDGQYLYTTICRRAEPIVKFYIVDFDGSLLKSIDISDWWANQAEADKGAQLTGGPNDAMVRNGKVFLNAHTSCLKTMVNPIAGLESNDDFWVWVNGNGDYTNDHNYQADAAKPWVCFDYNVAPYTYTISADNNLFSITPSYDMGAVSFALMAPDGTGLSYYAYSGETAAIKWGNYFCDSGSAFDGIYTDNNSTGADDASKTGVWFVASDSFKGVISNQVAVADAAPAAFIVAQNTPNPFNPATTINFSIPKTGDVTVDVFNAAGQKVDTLVNSMMTAGSHSVTWNAAKFSNGVYFCTVKAGSFSKTVKMTLLK